jgi:hypothetical protein
MSDPSFTVGNTPGGTTPEDVARGFVHKQHRYEGSHSVMGNDISEGLSSGLTRAEITDLQNDIEIMSKSNDPAIVAKAKEYKALIGDYLAYEEVTHTAEKNSKQRSSLINKVDKAISPVSSWFASDEEKERAGKGKEYLRREDELYQETIVSYSTIQRFYNLTPEQRAEGIERAKKTKEAH